LEPDKKFTKGKWVVPLSVGLGDSTITKLFSQKSTSIKIPKTIGFVANYGRKGFYRVKYDEGILLDLKMLVDQKQIPPIDRWAIQKCSKLS
jgi:tricorn protease interacting factor F2/3